MREFHNKGIVLMLARDLNYLFGGVWGWGWVGARGIFIAKKGMVGAIVEIAVFFNVFLAGRGLTFGDFV